ncbi:MAG: helix-turn-helix transcriptional regulator [Myxococcota bacterium]
MQDEGEVYGLVLGRVIASLRERAGQSQAALAKAVGLTQPTLSRIERGQAPADGFTLRKIARAFGLNAAQLHELVDEALRRTEQAAEGAVGGGSEVSWWRHALAVAGVAGLGGLVAFAVAAALDDKSKDRR